jgi:hypothetical protein
MCFNPGPERRVPSPNRYIADAKFCFCKNNKRIIITTTHQHRPGARPGRTCPVPAYSWQPLPGERRFSSALGNRFRWAGNSKWSASICAGGPRPAPQGTAASARSPSPSPRGLSRRRREVSVDQSVKEFFE